MQNSEEFVAVCIENSNAYLIISKICNFEFTECLPPSHKSSACIHYLVTRDGTMNENDMHTSTFHWCFVYCVCVCFNPVRMHFFFSSFVRMHIIFSLSTILHCVHSVFLCLPCQIECIYPYTHTHTYMKKTNIQIGIHNCLNMILWRTPQHLNIHFHYYYYYNTISDILVCGEHTLHYFHTYAQCTHQRQIYWIRDSCMYIWPCLCVTQ